MNARQLAQKLRTRCVREFGGQFGAIWVSPGTYPDRFDARPGARAFEVSDERGTWEVVVRVSSSLDVTAEVTKGTPPLGVVACALGGR